VFAITLAIGALVWTAGGAGAVTVQGGSGSDHGRRHVRQHPAHDHPAHHHKRHGRRHPV